MLSKNLHSFLRLLKNKGFKEEIVTKIGLYGLVKSTTLESNKSLRQSHMTCWLSQTEAVLAQWRNPGHGEGHKPRCVTRRLRDLRINTIPPYVGSITTSHFGNVSERFQNCFSSSRTSWPTPIPFSYTFSTR